MGKVSWRGGDRQFLKGYLLDLAEIKGRTLRVVGEAMVWKQEEVESRLSTERPCPIRLVRGVVGSVGGEWAHASPR